MYDYSTNYISGSQPGSHDPPVTTFEKPSPLKGGGWVGGNRQRSVGDRVRCLQVLPTATHYREVRKLLCVFLKIGRLTSV